MASPGARLYRCSMILEIGVIIIAVVGFVILDLYVLGCENV
jgi:hypothetical protein